MQAAEVKSLLEEKLPNTHVEVEGEGCNFQLNLISPVGGADLIRFHVVFGFQASDNNVKLKDTDSTNNQIVIMQWAENLYCTFF